MATVSRPAEVTEGMQSAFGKIMVNGPGQKCRAKSRADSGISRAALERAWTSWIWTIKGLSCGRPLASKIEVTAWGLVASAANPYTVSVGIATKPPFRRIAAACSRLFIAHV